MAAGPVTCVSLYDTGDGYRMTAFEGVSLGGERRIEGWTHAAVRTEMHVCHHDTRVGADWHDVALRRRSGPDIGNPLLLSQARSVDIYLGLI